MLYFESNKAVCIKKISKTNTQFLRCEKALKDNSIKESKSYILHCECLNFRTDKIMLNRWSDLRF